PPPTTRSTLSLHDALPIYAGRAALVEADGQRLQVLEDADAQVGERALSDPADEIGLHVGHRPHDQRRDEEGDDHDYERVDVALQDRKSTRLNSSHLGISYA